MKTCKLVVRFAVAALTLLVVGASCPRKPDETAICQSPLSGPFDPLGKTTEQGTILPAAMPRDFFTEPDRYLLLEPCAGWQRQVRTDLVSGRGKNGPVEPPSTLLSLVHLSDVHIIDAESPMRIEFLRHRRGLALPAAEFQAAFRPQETMTSQVTEAMVRQINAVGKGPVTGRPFDLAVSTGDSGDNHQLNELRRFVDLLNGRVEVRPNSGGPSYEGVQDQAASPLFCQYWHPDPAVGNECVGENDTACGAGCVDKWKTDHHFPDHPGLLAQVVEPFRATGLDVSWYTSYGNHDELIQGNFPLRPELAPENALSGIAIGNSKRLELPASFRSEDALIEKVLVDKFLLEFLNPLDLKFDWSDFVEAWKGGMSRTVTPDPGRRLWTRKNFVQTLLDRPGPQGPAGHGFSTRNRDSSHLYYAFDLVSEPRIRGIVLDTTNPSGQANGSIDRQQVAWLEDELKKVHGAYLDADGTQQMTGNDNALVVLFSHHDLATLDNTFPPACGDRRAGRGEAYRKAPAPLSERDPLAQRPHPLQPRFPASGPERQHGWFLGGQHPVVNRLPTDGAFGGAERQRRRHAVDLRHSRRPRRASGSRRHQGGAPPPRRAESAAGGERPVARSLEPDRNEDGPQRGTADSVSIQCRS